jgi:ADP-ribose pyrophosphatase YjhB (NUDIX family)
MIFTNRENERVELADGRVVWLSRATAVVASIYMEDDNGNWFVAMVKRGKCLPDEVGKWVMPCGYVDWDEDVPTASKREVYEETGLNIDEIMNSDYHFYHSDYFTGQATLVTSKPKGDAKQNISHHFVLAASVEVLPEFDMSLIDPAGEVADIKWIPFTDLGEMEENEQIGFSHFTRIQDFVEKLDLQ